MALKVTPTYETPQSSFQKSQKGTLNEFRRRVFLFGEIYGISKDTCYVSKMRHKSNDVERNNENTNVIMGDSYTTIHGNPVIRDRIGDHIDVVFIKFLPSINKPSGSSSVFE